MAKMPKKKKYEGSKADKGFDKKFKLKEGSKADDKEDMRGYAAGGKMKARGAGCATRGTSFRN